METGIYDQEKFRKDVRKNRLIDFNESQEKYAHRTKISKITIMRIEQGHPVTLQTVHKLCSHVGLDYKKYLL